MTSILIKACLGLAVGATLASAHIAHAEEPSDAETKPSFLVDGGEGEPIPFPLHPTSRLVAADSNEAGLSLFEIEIPADTAGAPPHKHTHEDEFFYVREGSVTFMVDDERETISAGGLAMLPRGGTHAMWNDSDATAVLLVGTSAGQFDDFFDAVAMEVMAAGDLSPPEIGEVVGRLGAERGLHIDMSKVPADVRPLYGLPPLDTEPAE